ncbi:MAG: pilus assembly protein [Labilithrix sp.]|nr:pilus assembly protein [Labilithrix sp.]
MISDRSSASLRRDTRGAVYVEFLVAFLPVFVFFLCLLQLALLFSARLVVDHAAIEGARAAAVVIGDEPAPYREPTIGTHTLSKERQKAIRSAVLIALAPLILDDTVVSVGVKVPDSTGGKALPADAPIQPRLGEGMVRVRVEAVVVCKIGLANVIACEPFGSSALRVRTISTESAFPYQGARYAYE